MINKRFKEKILPRSTSLRILFYVMISFSILVPFLPMEYLCPLLIIALGVMFSIIIYFMELENKGRILALFNVAFLLRIIFSVILYHVSYFITQGPHDVWYQRPRLVPGYFIGDGMAYGTNGLLMAKYWNAGYAPGWEWFRGKSISGTVSNYDYFNGHVFHFGGYNPLTIFFINSLCGALSVVLVYAIAKHLFGRRAALLSGWFAVFCPSLILWSSQNLKEPIVILSSLLTIWSIISIWNNFRFRYLFTMIASMVVLASIRFFVVPILIFSFFFAIIISVNKANLKAHLFFRVVIAALLIYFGGNFLRSAIQKMTSIDIFNMEGMCRILSAYRGYRSKGSLSFFSGTDLTTPLKVLFFVPMGFIYVLFSPFPWQIGSISQVMAVPEMIAWYILIPKMLKGVRIAMRRERRIFVFLCTFSIIYLGILALIEGNIGTMFRHRSIVWILYFIFIGGGIAFGQKEDKIGYASAQKVD